MGKGFGGEGHLNNPKARAVWEILKIYHPYRYAACRPWAAETLKRYRCLNDGKLVSTGSRDPSVEANLTEEQDEPLVRLHEIIRVRVWAEAMSAEPFLPYAYLATLTCEALTRLLQREVDDDDVEQRAFGSFVENELMLYSHWACHSLNNRAVFDFTPELTSLFARSEVGEAVLDQIHLPAETVYLHFGLQPNLPLIGGLTQSCKGLKELWDGTREDSLLYQSLVRNGIPPFMSETGWDEPSFLFEGAYVSKNHQDPEGSLQIALVGRQLGDPIQSPPRNFLEVGDEMLGYHLPCFYPGISIKESLEKERANVEAENMEPLRIIYSRLHTPPGLPSIEPFNTFDEWIERFRDTERQSRECFERVFNLILNAILYVSSYPQEIEDNYHPNTPPVISKLIESVDINLPPKTLSRQQRELENLGYTKIKFCGRKITAKAEQLRRRNSDPSRKKTFKGRIGSWRWLDSSKGHFKVSRHVWVRPSPDPTGTRPLTIYEVE